MEKIDKTGHVMIGEIKEGKSEFVRGLGDHPRTLTEEISHRVLCGDQFIATADLKGIAEEFYDRYMSKLSPNDKDHKIIACGFDLANGVDETIIQSILQNPDGEVVVLDTEAGTERKRMESFLNGRYEINPKGFGELNFKVKKLAEALNGPWARAVMAFPKAAKYEFREKTKISIGDTFGKLTVIANPRWNVQKGGSETKVPCRCECGQRVIAKWDELVDGEVASCGRCK